MSQEEKSKIGEIFNASFARLWIEAPLMSKAQQEALKSAANIEPKHNCIKMRRRSRFPYTD